MARILLAGSRQLPVNGILMMRNIARDFASVETNSLVTGCATGADMVALASWFGAGNSNAEVFAVGGQKGQNFQSKKSYEILLQAKEKGAKINWWAGGFKVPKKVQLAIRSKKCAINCDFALFVVSRADSKGSLGTATIAASRGVPVVFLNAGFTGLPNNLALEGYWKPFKLSVCSTAVLWTPSQSQLFSKKG